MNDFSLILGLIAMTGWGIADFIQGVVIRRLGTAMTMMVRNLFTLALNLVLGLILITSGKLEAPIQAILLILGSSAFYVVGYLFYMRGFEVGKSSVVAPIASSYCVITVILSVLFNNETVAALQIAAIICMVSGVYLLSMETWSICIDPRQPGVKEALLALTFLGVAFYVAGFASKSMAGEVSFFYSSFSQAIIFLMLSFMLGARLNHLSNVSIHFWGTFGLHSLLVNGAWLAYLFGTNSGNISIVAPISSVFSGVTALLAIVITRERLIPIQYFGLVLITLGVFTITI
ncbi:DMT family transporter [Brenneria goodwinii]|uniref:EamA family transporter n=1 Tax=Brenneria goodwinii TaxID=1109412 RepID=UPI0036F019F9